MEKQYKKIEMVLPPPEPHMVGDGFRVHNFFPSHPEIGSSGMSPFYLLDYGSKWYVPPSDTPGGVGVHPHRGFEAVTIAYQGSVAHHDSVGNSGIINKGDVQWMTAGSGVLHKEYHEKEFSRKGGLFQMAQIWVNLPAKYKMTQPKYHAIENKNMPRFFLDDNKSFIEVIAGEYNTLKGPATTFSTVNMFNARLLSGAKADISFSKEFNTGIVVIEGEIKINNTEIVPEDHFVMFGHDGEDITIEALRESVVLIISGEPIREPIVSSGPFLMNTNEEIKQAFQDYRNGKFGFLEE
jgi:quercetin 2,3-dioxygenase